MKTRASVPAGQFKAQCLSLLDRVARTGEPVLVTKRGRPVARVVPVGPEAAGSLRGSVAFHGDIVAPILDPWDFET
jgi:prevent-host-death family protein